MIPMMLVCSVMTCLLSSLSSAGPVKDPMEGNSLTKDDANLSWLSSPLISRSRALMETPLYLWLRANAGQADPLGEYNMNPKMKYIPYYNETSGKQLSIAFH